MIFDNFNYSCQGESHKAIDKVCQDYSYSHVYENGRAIAVVCDGHGGQRYFRSDVGARLACEITKKNIQVFVDNIDASLFIGKPYTSVTAIATQISNAEFEKESPVNKSFRQLFSSIIYEWERQVQEHAEANPITSEESEKLDPKWVEDFKNGSSLEKVYGCTLMAFVALPEYWFAFHIGDGKCIAFNRKAQWSEPIPWDDRCFLNRTTSICDSQALDEFRYCFQGNGEFPLAVFLGSDGIDDSFGAEENMVNFYIQILKSLVKDGKDATTADVESTLPKLSKIGSQDDMSIACVYDSEALDAHFLDLVNWQLQLLDKTRSALDARIEKAQKVVVQIEESGTLTKKMQIDYNYAVSDIEKAEADKKNVTEKIDMLRAEYSEHLMRKN